MTDEATTLTEPDEGLADKELTLAEKLAAAAGKIGPIDKDERNDQQGFNYRSLEAIVARANHAFAELGIAVLPSVQSGPDYEEVSSSRGTKGWRCTIVMGYQFTDGVDTLFASMPSEAIDYGDKSTSKAAQMAYKYALVEVLMIGGDADADAFSPEVVHRDEPQESQEAGTEYLSLHVAMLAQWDEDTRRDKALQAIAEVGAKKPITLNEAERVFELMQKWYYEEHPPSDDEAPF